ncbi:DUF6702 family protein [Aquimarina sediminis]|uniref:DUF6702 family protein n=1 Tax=Aquimarina sediminis TaxID=2070536 RepID=UPI000CA03B9F|nr:DUF6702 family protein [Aquimarina sediminis]
MNKAIIVFLFILSTCLSSFTVVHKFYVSVTQVEYNKEQKSLQIISRIFIDDIEDLLKERYSESIDLDESKKDPEVQKYLSAYLGQKLSFVVNGKKVPFTFIGKEYEEDLVICYLEIEDISSLDTIEVTNQVLMDLFDEQQNIIHVKKGDQRKSLILEKERDIGMLKFSE